MRQILVRYKVAAGRAEENEQYVRQVFAELNANAPDGVRYASFKGEDGLTFFHLVSFERDDDSNPLGALAAFQEFQRDLRARCDEPPQPNALTLVGSYRFFDA